MASLEVVPGLASLSPKAPSSWSFWKEGRNCPNWTTMLQYDPSCIHTAGEMINRIDKEDVIDHVLLLLLVSLLLMMIIKLILIMMLLAMLTTSPCIDSSYHGWVWFTDWSELVRKYWQFLRLTSQKVLMRKHGLPIGDCSRRRNKGRSNRVSVDRSEKRSHWFDLIFWVVARCGVGNFGLRVP